MAAPEAGAAARWGATIRAAPLGVLVIGAVLFLLGGMLVVGGVYLALARGDTGWFAWACALLLGPVTVYVALHLVRRTHWSWLALVLLLGLLVASSLVRVAGSPSPVAPLGELVLEVGCLAYLARRDVRRAFGRD